MGIQGILGLASRKGTTTPKNCVQKINFSTCTPCPLYVLCLRDYCLLLLFTQIFPIPVVECFFTNHLSSAVLINCVSSVVNWVLNAVLAPLSAVVANHSSSAHVANCFHC